MLSGEFCLLLDLRLFRSMRALLTSLKNFSSCLQGVTYRIVSAVQGKRPTWEVSFCRFDPRQGNKLFLSEAALVLAESALLSLSEPASARRRRKGSEGIMGSSESLSLYATMRA